MTGSRAKSGMNISFQLDEIEDPGKKGYVLTVENLKKDKGRYKDSIYLSTDSKVLSEIEIYVQGRIFAPKPKPVKKKDKSAPVKKDESKKETIAPDKKADDSKEATPAPK